MLSFSISLLSSAIVIYFFTMTIKSVNRDPQDKRITFYPMYAMVFYCNKILPDTRKILDKEMKRNWRRIHDVKNKNSTFIKTNLQILTSLPISIFVEEIILQTQQSFALEFVDLLLIVGHSLPESMYSLTRQSKILDFVSEPMKN